MRFCLLRVSLMRKRETTREHAILSRVQTNSLIYGLSCFCHPDKGIRYVGKTTQGMDARMKEHIKRSRKPLYPVNRWIAKHGAENIEMQVLEYCETEMLNDRESFWVAEKKTFRGDYRGGLNANRGGTDVNLTQEQIQTYAKRARDDGSNGAVLNWDAVREIRWRYVNTDLSTREISEDYPVGYKQVVSIVSNKTWHDPDYIYPGLKKQKPRVSRRKLSIEQVTEIRIAFCEKAESNKSLAARFGVSSGTISEVVNNRYLPDQNYRNTRKENFPAMSNEHRAKISKSSKGRKKPEGFGDKISKANAGEKHPMSKLTESDVLEIISLLNSGESVKSIASTFAVSVAQVRRIKTGERWGHLSR